MEETGKATGAGNDERHAAEDDPILEPGGEAAEAAAGDGRPSGETPSPPEDGASDAEALAEARRELAELNDKYIRLYAEFENFRKRTAMDREELRRYANEQIVSELLTVIDHLEMALRHADETTVEQITEGVRLTLKEFERLLEKFGVRPISASGQSFDPTVHHAMSQVVTTDFPPNAVVEEFRKGYKLHDRVIRPALVSVAKGPEPGGPAPEGEPSGGADAADGGTENEEKT